MLKLFNDLGTGKFTEKISKIYTMYDNGEKTKTILIEQNLGAN